MFSKEKEKKKRITQATGLNTYSRQQQTLPLQLLLFSGVWVGRVVRGGA